MDMRLSKKDEPKLLFDDNPSKKYEQENTSLFKTHKIEMQAYFGLLLFTAILKSNRLNTLHL